MENIKINENTEKDLFTKKIKKITNKQQRYLIFTYIFLAFLVFIIRIPFLIVELYASPSWHWQISPSLYIPIILVSIQLFLFVYLFYLSIKGLTLAKRIKEQNPFYKQLLDSSRKTLFIPITILVVSIISFKIWTLTHNQELRKEYPDVIDFFEKQSHVVPDIYFNKNAENYSCNFIFSTQKNLWITLSPEGYKDTEKNKTICNDISKIIINKEVSIVNITADDYLKGINKADFYFGGELLNNRFIK